MAISEDVHNLTEQLLEDQILISGLNERYPADFVSDLCCLALNRLPVRYVRHHVDALSALSDGEREDLTREVISAVKDCEHFLKKDRRIEERDIIAP